MSNNTNKVEVHGCIVCGKLYDVLVVYTPSGNVYGYSVTSAGAHPLAGGDKPLVACDRHTGDEIKSALAKHHPGPQKGEDHDED